MGGVQVKSGERAWQISDVRIIISVNLLSTYLVSAMNQSTNQSIAHELTLLKFTPTLLGGFYYYPIFWEWKWRLRSLESHSQQVFGGRI